MISRDITYRRRRCHLLPVGSPPPPAAALTFQKFICMIILNRCSICGGSMTETSKASGCPISRTDYTVARPLFETYELRNAERERGPFLINDSRRLPFWMITEYGHVLEALQMPDVFSNEVISALTPEHTVDLLPQYLDPPQHTA